MFFFSVKMDVLSQSAFIEDEVRQSAWGMHFDFFLPLVINSVHGERGLIAMKEVRKFFTLSYAIAY